MSETKAKSKFVSIVSICICILLSIMLISNVIVIVKGTVNPDTPPSVLGMTSMIVLSGSMSGDAPDHIETGDMIFARTVDISTLKVGDIITFMENGKTTITHRIIGINEDGTFKTKGDANNTEDRLPVEPKNVIGKFMFRIPKLGDVAMFAQTPIGMLLFIGVPVLFYVFVDFLLRVSQNKKKNKEANAVEDENAKLREELEKLRSEMNNKDEE